MDNWLISVLTTFGDSNKVCSCVETSLFGRVCSDGSGKEIFMILAMVVNIISIGIAIFAAVGIAVFGIQWLTSNGEPAKLTKAKSRLFNIVIGVILYLLLYSILEFLLPGGVLNPDTLAGTVDCVPTPTGDSGGGAGGGSGGGGSGSGGSGENPPTQPTFNRLCGPELPGALDSFGEPNPKYDSDGSTLASVNGIDKYLTRKYTTSHGRVYYVFVQQNPVWGNETAGNSTMYYYGCRRTSYAIILRSYGAEVTPLNFIGSLGNAESAMNNFLNKSPTSQLSIKVGKNYNLSQFSDAIWSALTKGGAVILQVNVNRGSSIFFGGACAPKEGKTHCQHNMPIVDWRINNGVREVYFLDTRPSNSKSSMIGWHKLADIISGIGSNYNSGNTYITTYTPQNQINCMP